MDQEKENDDIRKDIVTKARILEGKYPNKTGVAAAFEELGICSNCNSLLGVVTKFGNKFAKCQEFGIKLKENDPINVCTAFWNKGHSEIKDLIGMATLIDVKRKIGFGDEDDYY